MCWLMRTRPAKRSAKAHRAGAPERAYCSNSDPCTPIRYFAGAHDSRDGMMCTRDALGACAMWRAQQLLRAPLLQSRPRQRPA